MESNLWSYFKCQQCGRCCENSGLPWDPDNIEKMAEFLKMVSENLVTRYYGDIYWKNGERFIRWDQTRRKPCQFLGEDKSCKIYPVRPAGCKAYPIDTDFGRCGVDCPAMKVIDEKEVEKEEDSAGGPVCLLFENPEEKGVSSPPFAYICLGSCSHIELLGNEHTTLSPQCSSVAELKWWAEYIRKSLSRVVKGLRKSLGRLKRWWALLDLNQ